MFLLFITVIILMFPAAGVLLIVSVHESMFLIHEHQKQTHLHHAHKRVIDGIKRTTTQIIAIMGLGDD